MRKETQARKCMRLINLAYKSAGIGDEAKARSYWRSARLSGYEPNANKLRSFEIAITKGINETRACPGTESGTE